MIYKTTSIDWDCDGDDPKEFNLPTEVEIPTEVAEDDEYGAVADYLSDKYGFCVFGYHITKVKDNKDTEKPKDKENIYVVVIRTMDDMNAQSSVGGVFTTKKQAIACYRQVIKAWKKREKDTFDDAVIERYDDATNGYSFSAYLEGYSCDWSRDVWIEACELNHNYIGEM